jgi:hypothetical protein
MKLCHFTTSMKTSAFNGLWSHLLEERVKQIEEWRGIRDKPL